MREYHDRILKHKGDLLYFTLKFWFHLIAYKSTISLSVDKDFLWLMYHRKNLPIPSFGKIINPNIATIAFFQKHKMENCPLKRWNSWSFLDLVYLSILEKRIVTPKTRPLHLQNSKKLGKLYKQVDRYNRTQDQVQVFVHSLLQ